MPAWGEFTGLNRGYVLELYDRYRRDPSSVDAATRELFQQWTPPAADIDEAAPISGESLHKAVGAVNLAQSIRRYGHLAARLDPLGLRKPLGDPSLSPENYGITDEDLRALPASLISSPLADGASSMYDVVEAFRRLYCSTTGYDYAHVFVPEERRWLRHAAECGRFRAPSDPIDPRALLDRLTQVEVFERFLHRSFPGKTRFSIEGVDIMIPILDEVIAESAEAGISSILIGMAHRGRLNVMAHVLNKPYAQILAEFKDPVSSKRFREDMSWTGDVKYHAGAHRAIKGGRAMDLVVSMPPNPSHLEAIDPVVEGMARAAGTAVDAPGAPKFDPARSVPILIHGDAAFPGQGVVAETLNLSRLPGYNTGGTIHIIANNQLGFTTGPEDAYSTSYASGLARGFKIPIVHVNADDPEACVEAARLAIAYRAKFQRDFLIDLIGYRRYGHNEGDEASFTQPLMYAADRVASDGARDLGAHAGRSRRDHRGDGRGAHQEVHRRAAGGARRAGARTGLHRAGAGGAAAWRRGAGRDRRAARSAPQPERVAADAAVGFHDAPQARAGAREAAFGAQRARRTDGGLVAAPRSWRSRRSWPTGPASA